MTTARTLITSALRTIGVTAEGQPLSAEDGQNCLVRLNDMIDAWAIEKLFASSVQTYTATISGQTATVGPAGDIVTPATPSRIENVFVRVGNLDFGVDMVTYDQYADISLKSIHGPWPATGYYDKVGTLYLYPAANNTQVFIGVLQRLSEFATLDTDYALGAGIRKAMSLSLAEEIAPEYGRPLAPNAAQLALRARRMLKRSNHVVPQLGTYASNSNANTGNFVGGSTGTSYDGVDGGRA